MTPSATDSTALPAQAGGQACSAQAGGPPETAQTVAEQLGWTALIVLGIWLHLHFMHAAGVLGYFSPMFIFFGVLFSRACGMLLVWRAWLLAAGVGLAWAAPAFRDWIAADLERHARQLHAIGGHLPEPINAQAWAPLTQVNALVWLPCIALFVLGAWHTSRTRTARTECATSPPARPLTSA